MKQILIVAGIAFFAFLNIASAQNITIDAGQVYQTIHGLGVNINPQSWNVNPKAVKKVIDSLVDGMGCTSFRLMYDDCDWEAVNDNGDPDVYNWTYYDSVYSAPRFTCVWNTVQYLNSKGVTDITLSPDGASPAWMGGTKLNPEATKEYAEMMSSMVYYGLKRRKPALHFSMLSPINETTCDGNEGAMMTPEQFGTLFGAIATHLTRDHITALTLIGPDDCGGWAANYHAMVTNPVAMSKIRFFGQHQYGNNTSKGVALLDSVRHSRYPDRGVIMTEANTICRGCDGGSYNSNYGFDQYAGPAYKYILQHLNAGVNGVQIWEGYDSRYHHPNRTLTWSMWGIFAVNDTTHPDVYTQRAHYYVFKQLFRFVKPGFKRIGMSTKLSKMTVSAFYNPASKTIVITGKNDSDQAQDLDGILKNLPASASLKYYYSDEQHHFLQGPDVKVAAGRFSKSVPASSVFTLVGK